MGLIIGVVYNMKFTISILIFLSLSSCVSSVESNSESFQSKILKRSLTFLQFKQSILDNLEQNRQFVDPNSEQRTPPKSILKKYKVETISINSRAVYILQPSNRESTQTILYLHGGAYMANILPIHWKFLDKIIERTHVTVILPDYPLAPENNWKDAFEFMEELQSKLLNSTDNLIFAGDSAGAGLALAWTMEIRDRKMKLPETLILLSPWLDISMSNSSITAIENLDPYLTVEALTVAGKYWSEGINSKNWRVSPIYGSLNGLPVMELFTGTSDILNPDAKLFYSRVIENSGIINLYEYNNMIHDWMFFNMPESQKCLDQITAIINREN